MILVKDLSRFGRNYIEFGQYTDYLFPSLGCRFIALNNGIDTESNNGSTDVMCFLNLFNEFYSRDTSKKVKAMKKACAESGKFMGTYPAYGYIRIKLNLNGVSTKTSMKRLFQQKYGKWCRNASVKQHKSLSIVRYLRLPCFRASWSALTVAIILV